MNFRIIFSTAILVSMLSSACSVAADPIISAKFDGGEAQVTVRSIRDAAHLNVTGVVVYGDMHITSSARIAKADLSCFYLSSDAQKSSKPYVASVAHVLTNNFIADTDGAVRVQLYWIFKGARVADFKATKIEIAVDQSKGKCLVHALLPKEQASQSG